MAQEISVNSRVASQATYEVGQQENKSPSIQDALTQKAVPEAAAEERLRKAAEEKAQQEQAKEEPPEPVSREQMEQLAENLQDFISSLNKSLEFKVDEASGKDVITVSDKESGEVIRQYPSEEVLELMSRLADSVGLLVQTEV